MLLCVRNIIYKCLKEVLRKILKSKRDIISEKFGSIPQNVQFLIRVWGIYY